MDELKEKYLKRAYSIIKRTGELNIVYLRVSTKNEGQDENDQWTDIEKTFNLEKKNCLIIKARESGFQIKKQKFRIFNIILELMQELENNVPKKCYFWSIDRIYRNRELTEDFYNLARKTNTKIFSYQEQFINMIADLQDMLPPDFAFIIDMQVKQLVSFFAWMGEMESKKKGDRLLKSLTKKDGRLYTNKGNLYGKKLKNSKGKKLKLSHEELDILERTIKKAIDKGKTYSYIQRSLLEKRDIKVSLGYLSKIKNKKFINNISK